MTFNLPEFFPQKSFLINLANEVNLVHGFQDRGYLFLSALKTLMYIEKVLEIGEWITYGEENKNLDKHLNFKFF